MGKRILVQRRGRGSPTFRSPGHKRRGKASLPRTPTEAGVTEVKVVDLLHDPGRGAPLARVRFEDGTTHLTPVAEGVYVGQMLEVGDTAQPKTGNILSLENIPDGTLICSIEQRPGDGGKFARSSGGFGTIRTHSVDKVIVKMPSGVEKAFHPQCRAMIGVIAGGGRTEKPFLKAGYRFHSLRAKSKTWPVVRGVAMNAVSHPHGGGSKQHPGKSTSVSRHAPPGRKVGLIAPQRTGRKRRK